MQKWKRVPWIGGLLLVVMLGCGIEYCQAQSKPIPAPLKDWEDWATWDERHRNCPTPYHNADEHICYWPGRLQLSADSQQATWKLDISVFETSWVPLPGSAESWPVNVQDKSVPLAVIAREGVPTVQLTEGRHELSGQFRWDTMPQRLRVPLEIGILSLNVSGSRVAIPNWDAQGDVWLQRIRAESTDKDLLSLQVYRVIEDGIPLWLRTELELTVSGKSREEDLGSILPEGWQLSQVDSPIPVAVDDLGHLKAQVRAGKWTVALHAFLPRDLGEFRFAADAHPIANVELIGFQANPAFRVAEMDGITPIDVAQTTFPEKWRNFPVFQWNTNTSFRLVEKMRGMGAERPAGLTISRRLWLDEDGHGFTFRDQIHGPMQQVWRLDVAEGQQLGAVRVDGVNQLITSNPQTGAHGFEVRTRNLNLDALGRIEGVQQIAAAGWQADVDALDVSISLPPGWRMLALFGADQVQGDWLTAWTLFDLFLLLVFSLAVFRLWGILPGLIAFVAFGLAYHEPHSPRLCWLFLLMPVALLRVIPPGTAHRLVTAWKYVAVAFLAIVLIPYIAREVQSLLYPQLEESGVPYGPRMFGSSTSFQGGANVDVAFEGGYRGEVASPASAEASRAMGEMQQSTNAMQGKNVVSNFKYDTKSRIQTGPAEPEWSWNEVNCVWNGPVSGDQHIRLVMIPLGVHRLLAMVRVSLLLVLTGILLGTSRLPRGWFSRRPAKLVALLALLFFVPASDIPAQIPDKETLTELHDRLMEKSDAYPNTAEISSVELTIDHDKMSMLAEVHTVVAVAVPLPGRFPVWSPISVQVDGLSDVLLTRRDGYLWVSLPRGVHQIRVEGMLPDTTDWEWTYVLAPRRVVIQAPDWTVSGVGPNGVPEKQVLFARKQQVTEGEAAYDRKDFQAIVAVDRHLEVGLIWQARTEVTRLSAPGKAVSLRVPLLPGESVLSSNVVVRDGMVDVRLGAGDSTFAWQSELPVGNDIALVTKPTDLWVERWHLLTSPVWNVTHSGLAPVFESQEQSLIPVWHPWPGESANLSFSKPVAVSGETLTVNKVRHEVALGDRQRTSTLTLELEASLGSDLVVELDEQAEVTSLSTLGQAIPVRRDGTKLIVPVKPGKQSTQLDWRSNVALATMATAGKVTLPTESANITSVIHIPDSRWVLWADGPLRGPAVRFWVILVCALIAACVLGSLSLSPLRRWQWILLVIGLTQVHVIAALIVVGWFFVMALRGQHEPEKVKSTVAFNLGQILLILHTFVMLGVLIAVVGEGLLGRPEMFVLGNLSTYNELQWFQPRVESQLPEPRVVSISVWFYRLFMLFWALWLASALIEWLKWAWEQFSHGGNWRRQSILVATLTEDGSDNAG